MSIRLRLLLASSVLLVLPLLAAQFVGRMEGFLRTNQEQSIRATSRAIASALSDRRALFPAPRDSDTEDEERRRIVALFAAADPEAVASLGAAYLPSEEIERFLDIMGRRLRMEHFDGNHFTFRREDLPIGVYVFKIEDHDGRRLATGKIVATQQ